MKRKIGLAVVSGFFLLIASAALAQTPASKTAVLTIQADTPVAKVSPMLYGLMTEEINYSYDGGLYAEMVRNRTFRDDWSGVPHWILVERGDAQAAMDADKTTGPSASLATSLRLDVKRATPQAEAGILNDGYWGMALRPNTTYHGSFFAKSASAALNSLRVELIQNSSGKVLASTSVPGLGVSWAQHSFELHTGSMEPSAGNHLELLAHSPGTVWLSLVSLFPSTYRDRANGNRKDLMEKLAAMHPAFLRFPGGNYLEGNHISERFEWKKTIGPLVDRPTHPGPWGYQSSDGLGLLEFLEWCEDLKMQPVLAVYAGYSLDQEYVNPGPDLEPYVQDALDEIEYASGGPESKWGAVRAANGHPAPFQLQYIEVGNEDYLDRSGSYEGRYAQFYKAIKAKYPQLELIATGPVKGIRPDVIDDHYYLRAAQMFAEAGHYDKTDRSGPKIFVGEWATREGAPTPNFGAALGDAAWLTGLERNSDIVIMSSYAPLLVNVNPGGLQWDTDLIGYDALRSYGSPSYWTQVIFARNLGNEVLSSKVEGVGAKFFYSVTRDSAHKRLFLKLVNAASTPQPIEIHLDGVSVNADAKLTTLSAPSTQAVNTIDKPESIVPVESILTNVAASFHLTLPPYAIELMEIHER